MFILEVPMIVWITKCHTRAADAVAGSFLQEGDQAPEAA